MGFVVYGNREGTEPEIFRDPRDKTALLEGLSSGNVRENVAHWGG